jgi:2-succinyl-5-enolpyruvyl-6-hydroxy-3-cyclohexene-1-carboxylate synthase
MKHVGKMKNNSARVIVPYRTVPGEQHNCLVVGTQGLIDSHHDSLMALIESTEGQQANELADILSVRKFPDGSNMLQYLHANGHLKKVSTTMVLMTPNNQTSIPLNELNELIAKQKGIAVSDLSVSDNPSEKKEKVVETTVNPTVETASETKDKFQLVPSEMRSRADALYKEAARLRKEADELDPPKKKSKKDTITV